MSCLNNESILETIYEELMEELTLTETLPMYSEKEIEAIYDEISTVTKDEDDTFKRDCDRIFVELQSVTDTWYEENQHTY